MFDRKMRYKDQYSVLMRMTKKAVCFTFLLFEPFVSAAISHVHKDLAVSEDGTYQSLSEGQRKAARPA